MESQAPNSLEAEYANSVWNLLSSGVPFIRNDAIRKAANGARVWLKKRKPTKSQANDALHYLEYLKGAVEHQNLLRAVEGETDIEGETVNVDAHEIYDAMTEVPPTGAQDKLSWHHHKQMQSGVFMTDSLIDYSISIPPAPDSSVTKWHIPDFIAVYILREVSLWLILHKALRIEKASSKTQENRLEALIQATGNIQCSFITMRYYANTSTSKHIILQNENLQQAHSEIDTQNRSINASKGKTKHYLLRIAVNELYFTRKFKNKNHAAYELWHDPLIQNAHKQLSKQDAKNYILAPQNAVNTVYEWLQPESKYLEWLNRVPISQDVLLKFLSHNPLLTLPHAQRVFCTQAE